MYPKTLEERKRMNEMPYASAVGSIMYVMLYTRPDVAYALGVTNRFQADLRKNHWKVMKNILKYLRKTKDIFLIYDGGLKLKLVFNLIRMIASQYQDICLS